MKIAIFNYSSSGLFHYAACLANALARLPNTEILLLTSKYNNLELLTKRHNLTVFVQPVPHYLSGFFRWLASPTGQLDLYNTIKNFAPDVIHLTDSHAVCVPHAWWLGQYPIVFTQHDPVSHPGDVYRISSRLIHAIQRRKARRIVVHGKVIKDILINNRRVEPGKIAIIPHGEYSFFSRWQKESYQKIPNSVLFFGRIVEYKGLAVLLKSLLLLQDQNFAVTLILAGAGNLEQYQPLLKRIKLKQIVNEVIPESEIIHFFKKSTVVALPYTEASQSGIISIAMPARIPIVATRVGAIPEILTDGKNALLVPPNDPIALAQALKRVLRSPALRATLTAEARQTMTEKIMWSAVSQKYRQVYRSLL